MTVTAKVVTMAGAVIRTLAKTNVDEVHQVLKGHGTDIRLRVPKADPPGAVGQNADLAYGREIQVWRDGDTNPLAWAVVVADDMSSSKPDVDLTALGLGWYLSKRFLDAPRRNYLEPNAGFEDGLTGWTAVGGVTATVVSSPRRLGAQAVRLVGSATGGDQYLRKTFSISGDPFIGTNVHASSHFLVESFTGPAIGERGLYLEATEVGAFRANRATILDAAAAAELGAWKKARIGSVQETPIHVPAGATYDFDLRLYPGNASVVYDANQAVIPESVSDYNADLASLYGQLIEFGQAVSKGKSGLNIGTALAPSGITIPVVAWQYSEHTPVAAAVDFLTDRDPGMDTSIEFTATTRTATTWPRRRGINRSGSVVLTLGGNLASCQLTGSIMEVETSVTVYEPGVTEPDREEATATDTSGLGGLVLEGRYPAPENAGVDSYGPIATDRLARKKRPVRRLSAKVVRKAGDPIDYVGLLKPGDVVRVVANDGRLTVGSNWRIHEWTWRPRFERVLDLVLVEE